MLEIMDFSSKIFFPSILGLNYLRLKKKIAKFPEVT